jgi:spermidine synthase
MLMHGRTVHGGQFEPPVDKEPSAYYGRLSGIGMVMQNHPKRRSGDGSLRVGIIGLGVGTLAAYGQPGDYFRYYEIDPNVIALSSGPHPVFTYIQDSAAHVDTRLGDGRRLLEAETARGENQKFDVLVVDAFSGDAIPVHLLTREAFETYWQRVDPTDGIIAVHVSSRHINLMPVVQGAAAYFQAESVIRYEEGQGPIMTNCWVLLARRPEVLNIPGLEQRLPPDTKPIQPRLWTDDYSDLFRLVK